MDFRRNEAAAPPRRVAESKGPYSRSSLSLERSSCSVPYVLQQLLHFGFFVRRERQQRQTRDATEAPVVIHGILHTRDAQATDDALGRFGYTLLLLASESRVTLFPCRVNFIAGSGSAVGECEDRTHGSGIERRMQLLGGAHQHLEADFLLSSFQAADDRDRRG